MNEHVSNFLHYCFCGSWVKHYFDKTKTVNSISSLNNSKVNCVICYTIPPEPFFLGVFTNLSLTIYEVFY